MTILKSEEWSQAHQEVSESLSALLNHLRDLGYNPSLHVHYDEDVNRLLVDDTLLAQHERLSAAYQEYRDACDKRDIALQKIQDLPKLDLGF